MILLAQTTAPASSESNAAQSLADLAVDAAYSNRLYWSELWERFLGGSLWASLEYGALTIAVLALLLWGAFFLRGLLQEEITPALSELIWPLLVIIGLVHPAGQSSTLAQVINGARTVPYMIVDLISSGTLVDGLNLQESIRLAGYRIGVEQLVRNLYGQCAALPVKQFSDCLQDQGDEVETILSTLMTEEVFQDEATQIRQVFAEGLDPYTASTLTGQTFVRDEAADVVITLLLSWQKDTLPMFEYALMASAAFAPFSLAASLLPVGNRAILAWASSFVGICTAFTTYYILMGLAANNFIDNVGGLDSPAYLLKAGLIDPLVAASLGYSGARGAYWGMGQHLISSPFGYGFGLLRRH